MLQIRVRTVSDNGSITASSRVLETANVTYTAPFSASATLDFSVSRADFVPTQMPFLVAVEYAVNGGEFQRVPNEDLFVVEQDADDSKDLGQIVTYQAQAFVPWLLAGAYVGTGPFEKDGERTIDFDGQGRASSGHIMKYFIDESKGRGWLPALNYTFAVNTDSTGTNWNMDARAGISWRLETFYTQVLEQLTTQSFCDWSTTGNKLNMYNPGTLGVDRTEDVVLGGQDFERVPVKTDMTGWFTHVIALSDAGRVHVQNTAAETRFGRRSVAMTQSGVKDVTSSTKLANELLADGLQTKREESYRWTPEANQVVPWKDFNNGDMITAMSRGGALPRRVIGIMITQGAGVIAEVEVKVGEKISSLAARTRKKIDSVAVGGVAGGSGDAFPSNPGPSPLKPEKPVGLRITSNTGEWSSDGITALSNVGLEWDAVTQDIEGGEITVPDYEVWSRLPSGSPSYDTSTNVNTVDVLSWRPGEERLVSVRARSQSGAWSEWSNELTVTPVVPDSIVPKTPTNLIAVSNVGTFTATGPTALVNLKWDAVTQSTDNTPIEVEEYEVFVNGVPLFRVSGLTTSVNLASGIEAKYRVRAKSSIGFWGDLSTEITVTGATPSVVTATPSAPILSTGLGTVKVTWDGSWVGTAPSANTFLRIDIEARVGSGAWVAQTILTQAGSTSIVIGNIGDVVEVRLRAYDRLNRLLGTSVSNTKTVEGVDVADLGQAIIDELDALDTKATNAQTTADSAQTDADQAIVDALAAANAASAAQGTANSKGKTIIQNAAPAAADQLAQNLWIDTTGGANTPKRWSGSAWVAVTDKAATDAAAAAVIAQTRADDAFTTATNAATAAGNAQTAANGKNRVWYQAAAPAGTGHIVGDTWFDTDNGNQIARWSGSAWTVTQLGTSAIANLAITNAQIAEATIQSAKIANLDAAKITTGFLAAARIAANTIVTAHLAADSVTAVKILANEALFEKIFTNELMAGRIVTDHLEASVGSSLNITANGSITLMSEQQDNLSSEISDVVETLATVQEDVTAAGQEATAARSAAAIADGKALVAQNAADAATAGLSSQQAVFVVTPTGADVRSKDTTNIVRILPDGVSIIQGGVAVSTWDGARFISNEIITNQMQVANHKIEKSGTRTVFRAL